MMPDPTTAHSRSAVPMASATSGLATRGSTAISDAAYTGYASVVNDVAEHLPGAVLLDERTTHARDRSARRRHRRRRASSRGARDSRRSRVSPQNVTSLELVTLAAMLRRASRPARGCSSDADPPTRTKTEDSAPAGLPADRPDVISELPLRQRQRLETCPVAREPSASRTRRGRAPPQRPMRSASGGTRTARGADKAKRGQQTSPAVHRG